VRAEIVKINSESPETSLVKYAADQIRSGEVLGMPTDTFYGLAADPFNLRAVDKVYDIKTRSRHKPLSLLIESTDQAEELAKALNMRAEADAALGVSQAQFQSIMRHAPSGSAAGQKRVSVVVKLPEIRNR